MSSHRRQRSAGLPLSVGAASTPVRLLIAAVFFAVAIVCGAGGVLVATSGPLPAVIVAVAFLLPFAVIALIATMFVIAPLSRFGVWLDELVPTFGGPRGVAVAVVLWGVSALIVVAVRLFYATPMRVALLLSLTLAGGCLPIPHPYQDLPRINGTITADGVPLAGARVQVADVTRANPCERAEQAAVTDAAGRFTTPGRRRIRLFVVPLPVHVGRGDHPRRAACRVCAPTQLPRGTALRAARRRAHVRPHDTRMFGAQFRPGPPQHGGVDAVRGLQRELVTAMHSISIPAPRTSPFTPNVLRAGLLRGKYSR